MGTETDHKNKAEDNQDFFDSIDKKKHPDWAATVCFYKALHLIEMVLARSKRHSNNHRERHDILKREHVDLWKEYLPLYVQSRRARYKVRSISPQTLAYVQGRLAKLEQLIAAL